MCYTAPQAAMSPMEVGPHLPSTPAPVASADKGKHPNLILIVGIVAGILIIAVISMLIIYACASKRGKKKRSPNETGI